MQRVTVLEKPGRQAWSDAEVIALVQQGNVKIQRRPGMSRRLVLVTSTLSQATIEKILGHSNFTMKIVDEDDQWS